MQYPARTDLQKDDVLIAESKRPEHDLSHDLYSEYSDYALERILHERALTLYPTKSEYALDGVLCAVRCTSIDPVAQSLLIELCICSSVVA
jgi:hypothetical protein